MSTTVTSVKEHFRGRTFTSVPNGISASRAFIVVCSDTSDSSAYDVQLATGIPLIGDAYPITFTTGVMLAAPICTSKTSTLLDENDPLHWLVTCQYTDEAVKQQAVVTVSSVREQIVLESVPNISLGLRTTELVNPPFTTLAVGPCQVLNNADDPYDPPLMGETVKFVYRVSQLYAASLLCETWPSTYTNTINDASITIYGATFAAHTLRMLSVNLEKLSTKSDGSTYNWRVTFEIEYNPNGQYVPVLESGWEYINSSNKKVPFTNEDASKKRSPGLLDNVGGKLTTGGYPYYTGYWPFPTANFAELYLQETVSGLPATTTT